MSFLNNSFMEGLTKFADMVILSVLWLLFSIPVVTIVPATIALYYASVKVVRRQAGYPFRDFINGFKQNVRQGMGLSVLYLLIGFLLYTSYDFSKAAVSGTMVSKFFVVFWMVSLLLVACVSLYLIPVISRFKLSLISAMRLAVAFSFGNLKTLIPLMFTLAGAVVLMYLWPPAVMAVPCEYCFLLSFSVEKVIISYMRSHLDHLEEHETRWYMAD